MNPTIQQNKMQIEAILLLLTVKKLLKNNFLHGQSFKNSFVFGLGIELF